MKQGLTIAYLAAVLVNALVSCATPWWPQADRMLFWLGRTVLITSPVVLVAAAFGWLQPKAPLLLGAGAYVTAVLVGLVLAMVTVALNPDLTEGVTIEQLLERFWWYGGVYFALALVQVAASGVALNWVISGQRT